MNVNGLLTATHVEEGFHRFRLLLFVCVPGERRTPAPPITHTHTHTHTRVSVSLKAAGQKARTHNWTSELSAVSPRLSSALKMEGNVNDLQPGFMNPTQEDPEDRKTAKTARTSDSHTDEPMRKRRSGSHTDRKTPEKDTTDDRCAESVCEASSSSGISDGVEECVRDTTSAGESQSEKHRDEQDWERLREIIRKVDADKIRSRVLMSMLEESRVIWHQRLMEIKKIKASRNGRWMDQNDIDKVFQLLNAPLINADRADGALQPAEKKAEEEKAEEKEKAEEGKESQSEDHRNEPQKDFKKEYFRVVRRFHAQVCDESPLAKLREIDVIMSQIVKEAREIKKSPDALVG